MLKGARLQLLKLASTWKWWAKGVSRRKRCLWKAFSLELCFSLPQNFHLRFQLHCLRVTITEAWREKMGVCSRLRTWEKYYAGTNLSSDALDSNGLKGKKKLETHWLWAVALFCAQVYLYSVLVHCLCLSPSLQYLLCLQRCSWVMVTGMYGSSPSQEALRRNSVEETQRSRIIWWWRVLSADNVAKRGPCVTSVLITAARKARLSPFQAANGSVWFCFQDFGSTWMGDVYSITKTMHVLVWTK